MEPEEELTPQSPLGRLVTWKTVDGKEHVGRLKEWDNGTAIVEMNDGTTKAVRCE